MSKSGDIAAVVANPRLTHLRIETWLAATGWKRVGGQDNWFRSVWLSPKGPDYVAIVTYEDWSIIEHLADILDVWPLDVAYNILKTPLPDEECQLEEGTNKDA